MPGIYYVVSIITRFMSEFRKSHLVVAKRILRHLKGTIEIDVKKNKARLIGYSNSG